MKINDIKILVSFSGGKDSQAALIWAVKQYGKENVTAVFCDTKWEAPVTYQHIDYVIKALDVELVIISSKKYDGMLDMVEKKKRFPSTKARFCSEELKIKPMIDYILENQQSVLVIQGIRKDESDARSKMNAECTFFKYYFTPYQTNSLIIESLSAKKILTASQNKKLAKAKARLSQGKEDPKFHTYRKADVFEFRHQFLDKVYRPCFNWSGQEVIDYIIANGQYPNPLYNEGFKRVGCFPCVMCNLSEVKQLANRYPERIKELADAEIRLNSTFFPPDYIPEREQQSTVTKGEDSYKLASITDVVRYVGRKNATLDIFQESTSCMSFYGTCE